MQTSFFVFFSVSVMHLQISFFGKSCLNFFNSGSSSRLLGKISMSFKIACSRCSMGIRRCAVSGDIIMLDFLSATSEYNFQTCFVPSSVSWYSVG